MHVVIFIFYSACRQLPWNVSADYNIGSREGSDDDIVVLTLCTGDKYLFLR